MPSPSGTERDRVATGVYVTRALRDEARQISKVTGLTTSEVLRQAIEAGMPLMRERAARFAEVQP